MVVMVVVVKQVIMRRCQSWSLGNRRRGITRDGGDAGDGGDGDGDGGDGDGDGCDDDGDGGEAAGELVIMRRSQSRSLGTRMVVILLMMVMVVMMMMMVKRVVNW